MKFLSRKEELILLAVWKLQDDAYGVTIREYIEQMTGVQWIFGAIYTPLGRLVENGFVESYESGPTNERGGRSKTYFRLTSAGKSELVRLKEINSAFWLDIPSLI